MSLPEIEVFIEKLSPKILGRFGKENPSKRRVQSRLCAAQVRCDVVNFGANFIRYIQLVKQNLVYACRAAVSVVRYVYTFWNHLSEFLRQPGTPPCAA